MNIVQFPGLGGLQLEINRVAFTVFGISIYWYGIIIAFGFLLAVLLAVRDSKKFGIEPDNILDLVLFAAPISIVTARLYYVIFSWDLFKDNPIDIINTRKGGLAFYGSLIGAILVAWVFSRVKKIPFIKLADFCIPYVILAQGIGRWGNFVNQEAFGAKTDLPWRMNGTVPDAYLGSLPENLDLAKWGVHPTFLYESLWCIAVFFFLLWFRHRIKAVGEVLFLYLILYGFERFFVEGLRTDSLMLGSDIRVSKLLSALLVIAFAAVFAYGRLKRAKAEDDIPVETGHSEYGAVLSKLREEETSRQEDGQKSETPGAKAREEQAGDDGAGGNAGGQSGENAEEQIGENAGEQPGENAEEQVGGNAEEQPGENAGEQPGENPGENPGNGDGEEKEDGRN